MASTEVWQSPSAFDEAAYRHSLTARRLKSLDLFLTVGLGAVIAMNLYLAWVARLPGHIVENQSQMLLVSLCVSLAVIATYVAAHRGYVESAAFVLLCLSVLFITLIDTPQQVIEGRTMIGYAIPILAAGVLLPPLAPLFFAGLCSLAVMLLASLTMPGTTSAIGSAIDFFVIAIITWVFADGLERSNRMLARKIAEQKEVEVVLRTLNDELAAARDASEAASRTKSQFLASMSHEIRTPMNAVIGMTSLLLDTPLKEDQRGYVETIRSSGDALLTIINDILDFSKIESGKMELEVHDFRLAACLDSVLDLFGRQAAARNVALTSHVAPGVPPHISGDISRLRQILVNLVSNALKFTPSGSVRIEVTCPASSAEGTERASPEGDALTLQFIVRDTGIGIPADRLDRLFHSFSQVDPSTTRKYGGTGLGLAISLRLVDLMGGRMWVESQEGEGSTFYFTIRTRAAAEPPCAKSEAAVSLDRTLAQRRPLDILLAEDNVVNQRVAQQILGKLGYTIDIVANGQEALDALERKPYSLVLMDVQMPEMDGLEATRRILAGQGRGTTQAHRPTIIAMTAAALQEDRQACLDAGMDGFLSKPIRLEQLLSVLNSAH
jgi:signal transduction histidine kinase/ActR/RegA family two-component response regulator